VKVPDMMDTEALFELCLFMAYRVAGYALMNLADDVALLALMFC
jgi:hypothetical protein